MATWKDDVDLDLLISLTMIMTTLMFFFIQQRGKCVKKGGGGGIHFFLKNGSSLFASLGMERSAINPLNITVFACSLFRCAIYKENLSTARALCVDLITKLIGRFDEINKLLLLTKVMSFYKSFAGVFLKIKNKL